MYNSRLPKKEIRKIRDKEVKTLDRLGYSGAEIAVRVGVSKTTVFFVLNGRTKKGIERNARNRKLRSETEKIINKNNHIK